MNGDKCRLSGICWETRVERKSFATLYYFFVLFSHSLLLLLQFKCFCIYCEKCETKSIAYAGMHTSLFIAWLRAKQNKEKNREKKTKTPSSVLLTKYLL